MKKIIFFGIISLLIIIICTETYLLFNQDTIINNLKDSISTLNNEYGEYKNNKDEELAIKVTIETYKQFKKAGKLRPIDTMYILDIQTIKENMKIISASYTGSDHEIRDMLNKFNIHLTYIYDNGFKTDSMKKDEENAYYLKSVKNYSDTDDAVNKCISKYALFDKVGLDE